MLTGGLNHTFDEGKKYVIPLLSAILPGIEGINSQKTITTLKFISTFLDMIPLVDCSSNRHLFDLTMVYKHD